MKKEILTGASSHLNTVYTQGIYILQMPFSFSNKFLPLHSVSDEAIPEQSEYVKLNFIVVWRPKYNEVRKGRKTCLKKKVPEAIEQAVGATEITVAAKETPKKTTKKATAAPANDFDWEAFETKGFGEGYSKKEKDDLAKIYGETLTTVEEKKVVQGTVVAVNDRDVVLNIGFKSDGLVSSSEFRDTPDLKVGDQVEVYIEEQENAQGQLVLSRRKS